MKKHMVSIALAVVLALSLSVPASAKTETKTVTLTYAGIKVSLNGSAVNPADAQGNYIEPFAIDGTTYLPLRGIASALGLNVGWEQATHTVKLTSGGSSGSGARSSKTTYDAKTAVIQYMNIFIKLDGKDVWPLDANGNYVEPFAIDGTVYLPIRGIASALGLDVSWDQANHTVGLTKKAPSPQDVYQRFLQEKGYRKDTNSWGLPPAYYAYVDIDQDGINELVIQDINDFGYVNIAVYGYNTTNHTVYLIRGEGSDTFYVRAVGYFPKNTGLVFSYMDFLGGMGYVQDLYQLKNGLLTYTRSLEDDWEGFQDLDWYDLP